MLAVDTGVFGVVVFAVVIVGVIVGAVAVVGNRGLYDQIGRGGLSLDRAPEAEASPAECDEEIRQMLQARSDRMVRRGEAALDVDAEVKRLLEPDGVKAPREAGLIEEVRQLVVARNERRVRQGLEPLDVEAETERTLDELDA